MSWKSFLKKETSELYFKELSSFLIEDGKSHKIYPPHKDVFNAFKWCPLDNTKVVIVGMDPYHGANQAHGLSFSVLPGVPFPPSLRNILKEVNSDLGKNHSFPDGCLIPWAQQGVLLLNSVMTVREHIANSHKDRGWETLTDKAISLLNEQERPIAFLLWGSTARSKKRLLSNPKHLILESAHPSPLSAHNGFIGNKHFSKTNSFLNDNGMEIVNWFF